MIVMGSAIHYPIPLLLISASFFVSLGLILAKHDGAPSAK
jgi:hypothetical protein